MSFILIYMSCELSHVRFSSEIKKDLDVSCDKKYYQGVIYPDSRVITNIERNKTHDEKFTKRSFFDGDDFKKGWASHVIYDIVHNKVMEEMFGDLFKKEDYLSNGYSSISRFAIKILHDIEDAKEFNFCEILPIAEYEFAPVGEDLTLLNKYREILYDSYKNSFNLTIENYEESIKKFENKKEEEVDIVIQKVLEYSKDREIMQNIKNIYKISLNTYRKNFLL